MKDREGKRLNIGDVILYMVPAKIAMGERIWVMRITQLEMYDKQDETYLVSIDKSDAPFVMYSSRIVRMPKNRKARERKLALLKLEGINFHDRT